MCVFLIIPKKNTAVHRELERDQTELGQGCPHAHAAPPEKQKSVTKPMGFGTYHQVLSLRGFVRSRGISARRRYTASNRRRRLLASRNLREPIFQPTGIPADQTTLRLPRQSLRSFLLRAKSRLRRLRYAYACGRYRNDKTRAACLCSMVRSLALSWEMVSAVG